MAGGKPHFRPTEGHPVGTSRRVVPGEPQLECTSQDWPRRAPAFRHETHPDELKPKQLLDMYTR